MKVMIVPSRDQTAEKFQHPTVCIEIPSDDLNIGEFGDLVRQAALAWGFAEQNVYEELGEPS